MSNQDQDGAPEGEPSEANTPRRRSAPGVVQATAILLYVGGSLTVLFALTGIRSATAGDLLRSGAYLFLGVSYLGLARGVQRGRRWARRTILVLCGIGVVLAGVRLASGMSSVAGTLAWPVVYAILLNTGAARSWFRSAGLGRDR